MKSSAFSAIIAVFLALASFGRAQSSSDADKAFADFAAAGKIGMPATIDRKDDRAMIRWTDQQGLSLMHRGLELCATYPNDPRRWEVVAFLVTLQPYFIKELGKNFSRERPDDFVADAEAKAAWEAKRIELREAMARATDMPPTLREARDWNAFAADFRKTTDAKIKGEPYDYSGFRARFDTHAAKYVDLDDRLVARARDYLGAFEKHNPGLSLPEWQHIAATATNPALKQLATERVALAEKLSKPMELKFTAVDGRAVDLSALRGKVVLIDFWATWCGPCVAELPNVKKVYSAYHDKGFEIVGITLENARLAPTDTPEQAAIKLEVAKKKLTDFTAKENMPWPQYFDGQYWKGAIPTQYSVTGIPAMFLLDQDGKVVSTDARGEKLETEVKRLLKL